MLSLHVKRTPDSLFLMERDYPAQGISPYYTNVCRLTEDEAATLLRSRLVTPWLGATIEGRAGDPGDFIHYVEESGLPRVRIRLAASELRSKPVDIEVPLSTEIRAQIRSNPKKRAAFLANTGTRDTTVPG